MLEGKADPPVSTIPPEFTTAKARIYYMYARACGALGHAAAFGSEDAEGPIDRDWIVRAEAFVALWLGMAHYEQKNAPPKHKPSAPAPGG